MRRVLFDHNIPADLRELCGNHKITTAEEAGWNELSNGLLLKAAENEGFEVLLTADKNLAFQQNLRGRKIAIVVLGTNHWPTIRTNPAPIIAALDKAVPGSFAEVSYPKRPRRPKPLRGPSI